MGRLHSLLTANHRPYAEVYPDAATRLAATGFVRLLGGGTVTFTLDDLYKKALQLDDATEWILTGIAPNTWAQVSGAGSLANDSVTNAKLANMAQSTIKGRAVGAGTGDPTDLSATQATAILNAVVGDSGSGGTKGLVPAPGAGDAAAGKFLKADGTFAVPSGTGAETGANSDITSMDGLTGALENPTKIIFPEAAAPSTPGANKVVLYAKSDGLLYSKDDAGTESAVSGGGGGTTINTTDTAIPVRQDATTFVDSLLRSTSNLTLQSGSFLPASDGALNIGSVPSARFNQIAALDFIARDKFRFYNGGNLGEVRSTSTGKSITFYGGNGNPATIALQGHTPAQFTANQNDYTEEGGNSHGYFRWSSDASRDVTGISISQSDGEIHVIINVGSNNIVLKHQDANSSAVNRFLCSTAADITLAADQAADLIYDGVTQRWRVFKRN
jgi:hypothetical protein